MNEEIFQKTYDMLNPEQRDAVETLDGAVMVIAGPGTGKTQIIGMRTANIILKSGVNPENILITTFTEAGVIAIRERLISMMGSEAYKVHVTTVHSFAQDVISTFPEKFTIQKLDTAIDGVESLEILSSIVSDLLAKQELEYLTSYGDTLFYVRSIASSINDLKREGISPTRFQKSIDEETQKSLEWLEEKRNNKRIKKIENYELQHEQNIGKLVELHKIFEIYNTSLREKHLYDFNDMINFVLEQFRVDENLRAYYAETYQYIMLDEYQDTNNPQNEIVDLILSYGEGANIMVVGDDDQSIYRFQGANIENMLDFTTKYSDAKIIVLDKNYRSQQAVLDVSKSLIEHNSERLISRIPGLDKQLFSQRDFPIELPSLYMAHSEIDERLYILASIEKLLASGVPHEEIAIISRSNKEVADYSSLLKEKEIPVSSKLDSNILDNDYVKLIFSFFRLLEDPYSNEGKFLDILRSDLIEISNMDILKISTYLYRENYTRRGNKLGVFDVLSNTATLKVIGITDTQYISHFVKTFMDTSKQFSQSNFLLAMSYFLQHFKLLDYIEKNGNFLDLQDVYTLFHSIKSWAGYNKEISLEQVLSKVSLHEKYGYAISRQSQSVGESGVQIVTAHSSKGLEYEYVFIPGLYTGNWDEKSMRKLIKLPQGIAGDGLQFSEQETLSDAEKKAHQKDKQMQEDRRLFFVALTRAKKGLFLSFPASIGGKAKIISPFIGELGNIDHIESQSFQNAIAGDMQRELLQESKLISYGDEELDYIEEFLKKYKLSASDLNTFLVNPRDFLYRTILKYPFEENENSIFGTMYHRTLELFYKKILDTGEVQEYPYLEYVFLRQVEKEYLSHEEQERLKKRGLESLKGYYDAYQGTFQAPLKTEYKFSRRNIFFDDIPLTGIMDKIELISDDFTGNSAGTSLFSQNIRITDYKTGSTKYLGEIKGEDRNGNKDDNFERGRYGRQMLFYKLLFENDHELTSQYNLESLELDFCEGKKGKYKRLEVEFSQEEYEDFKMLVKDTFKQMTDINFWREYLGEK